MSLRSALTAASLLLLVTGASAQECGAIVRGDGNDIRMNCTIVYQQRDGAAALIDGIAKLAEIQARRGNGMGMYADDFDPYDPYGSVYAPAPRYVPDVSGARVPYFEPHYRYAPGPRYGNHPGPHLRFGGPRY